MIVVVDSTDRARVGIVKQELFNLLQHEHLSKSVVLVFANKQDLRDSMSVAELSEALDLISIKVGTSQGKVTASLMRGGFFAILGAAICAAAAHCRRNCCWS